MTAIALLNPHDDPHIVADTLLTAEGADPNADANVWLPALGRVKSEWESDDIPWYIARLGRKTFVLPNASGVLAFAGDCTTAFKFWSELSSKFININSFSPERKVDRRMVFDALGQVEAHKFSLLGVLIDNQGRYESIVHNSSLTLHTCNLGTCYIAGSGTDLVREIIRAHDQQNETTPTKRVLRRIGPTEDLAERISSQMLYAECDQHNGLPGTPIASRCGGFYEWFKVLPTGVLPMPQRLDLHLEMIDNKLFIDRAYYFEQTQLRSPPQGLVPSQRYSVRVLNLGLEPMELGRISQDWWEFSPAECYGVGIESTFELYDKPDSTARIEGPIMEAQLAELFDESVDIIRIRLVCSQSNRATLRSMSRFPDEGEVLARISLKDGKLCVQIKNAIADAAISSFMWLGLN